jgi:hypothetical protein
MEVARIQNNQVLLKQLEAEADYINTPPAFVNLKALLHELKSEKSHGEKRRCSNWFSALGFTRVKLESSSK